MRRMDTADLRALVEWIDAYERVPGEPDGFADSLEAASAIFVEELVIRDFEDQFQGKVSRTRIRAKLREIAGRKK